MLRLMHRACRWLMPPCAIAKPVLPSVSTVVGFAGFLWLVAMCICGESSEHMELRLAMLPGGKSAMY